MVLIEVQRQEISQDRALVHGPELCGRDGLEPGRRRRIVGEEAEVTIDRFFAVMLSVLAGMLFVFAIMLLIGRS
jgi:hypothetical protein